MPSTNTKVFLNMGIWKFISSNLTATLEWHVRLNKRCEIVFFHTGTKGTNESGSTKVQSKKLEKFASHS